MQAEELRIGNLLDRGDYIVMVTGLKDRIYSDPLKYEGERFVEQIHEPIPLTEEWLEKFGFGVSVGYIYSKGSSEGLLEIVQTRKNTWQPVINLDEYRHGKEIEHVHQLQNLYFALTGEELSIT